MLKKFTQFIGFIICVMPLTATAYNLTLLDNFKDHEGIGSEMTLIDSSWVISSIPDRKEVNFASSSYELDAEFKITIGQNKAFLYHLKTPVVNIMPIKRARLTNTTLNHELYNLKGSLFVATSSKQSKKILKSINRKFYQLSTLNNEQDLIKAWKEISKLPNVIGGGIFIKDKDNDPYELVGLIGKDFSLIESFNLNVLIDNIIIAYALGGGKAATDVLPNPVIENITENFGDHPAIAADFTLIDSSWVLSGEEVNKGKEIKIGSNTYKVDAVFEIPMLQSVAIFYLYHLSSPVVDVQPIRRARLSHNEFLELLPKSAFIFVGGQGKFKKQPTEKVFKLYNIADFDAFDQIQTKINNEIGKIGSVYSGCFIENKKGEYELLGPMLKLHGTLHLSLGEYQLFTLFSSYYNTKNSNVLIDNAIIAYALGGEAAARDVLLSPKERSNKKNRRSRSFGSLSELKPPIIE